jgi:hypothetical protein
MHTITHRALRRVTTGTLAAATSGALLVFAPSGQAAAPAPSTVTIKAEGTDIFGTVKSPRRACKADRKVLLFKVLGGSKGGGDDSLFASDITELQNGVGVWNTGNLGTEGRFYARVKKTDRCKRDDSPVIRVQRND